MKQILIANILDLYRQSPRVAILMSGIGSNANALLQNSNRYKNINFVTLCTDRKDSNAYHLSKKYHLDYFLLEGDVSTLKKREDYFHLLKNYLCKMKIDTLIYSGFMKISVPSFLYQFPGINIHPSDLTRVNEWGKPKYVGMHSVSDAIEQGEKYIASTVHVVDEDVDCGQSILVSEPLYLENMKKEDIHETLKKEREHVLYPTVLELMSKGLMIPQKMPYRWDALSL